MDKTLIRYTKISHPSFILIHLAIQYHKVAYTFKTIIVFVDTIAVLI